MNTSEIDFRRRWYQAHVARFESDENRSAEAKEYQAGFVRSADEALQILGDLGRNGDVEAFRAALQAWAVKPDTLAFNGFSGQMLVNQLVKGSDDLYMVGRLLADCLTLPRDEDDAAAKLRQIVEHIKAIQAAGQPAPRSAGFLLSYFWALADRSWPILWASASAYLEYSTGSALPAPLDERYRAYLDLVRELDVDNDEFERVASWWNQSKQILVDPVFVDRCTFGEDATGMDYDDLARNARALVGFARHVGSCLTADVSSAVGRELKRHTPGLDWKKGRPRSDAWVEWTDSANQPGIRVWISHKGMAIGLKPGRVRPGWYAEAAAEIDRFALPGFKTMSARGAGNGVDVVFTGGASGEFVYGRWYDREQLADLDLATEVVDVAKQVRPALDALIWLATGVESSAPGTTDPAIGKASEAADDDDSDPLQDLADELLVDRAFLDDLEALLEDRGQIILYGPPGTGKTYIAKKLAEVLAPDPDRRKIVQFHPSTSYEDFVEGYRPVGKDGQVTYQLVDGPLRMLADRAKAVPGTRHIMIIDEINRGNLPKILGELLFLLEYRDEKVATLYCADEEFELPSNLWFIGTMNTADRSIALIDAALRRRFHFVPIYPNEGPIEGVLEKWLDANGGPQWVAQLVAMVNSELVDALGGSHLQIGPSHFMRSGLNETVVRRIWRYNIEPLVEDQFFGDAAQIDRFRFDAVHGRLTAQVGDTAPDATVTPTAE